MPASNWTAARQGHPPRRSRQTLHPACCQCRRCRPAIPADRGSRNGFAFALAGILVGVLLVALGGAPALTLIFRSF